MTTTTVPQFDLADRLRKTLRHHDIGVHEMAAYLEVSRNTVSSWINGRNRPPAATVKLWALRCGVPYEWLAHGIDPGDGGDAPGNVRPGAPNGGITSGGLPTAEVLTFVRPLTHRRSTGPEWIAS